jgi:hypothetical protein
VTEDVEVNTAMERLAKRDARVYRFVIDVSDPFSLLSSALQHMTR